MKHLQQNQLAYTPETEHCVKKHGIRRAGALGKLNMKKPEVENLVSDSL
jgi:hypothetical protein